MKQIISCLVLVALLCSCGEYNQIIKSTDYEVKYDFAKKCFESRQYGKACTLLEELVPIYKGTAKAEESLYLLARSFYLNKDYYAAAPYFATYYNTYPRGEYAEFARFYCASSYYYDSPEPKLDQTDTYKAINELQMYLEYFPQGEKSGQVREMIAALYEKLAQKEFLNAKLYFDLGNYMGNNYQSCVITAQNALRDYPECAMREMFFILILRSKYEEARVSVEDKKADRFRDVVDEYHNYKGEYPEGKYIKEADAILKSATKAAGLKS